MWSFLSPITPNFELIESPVISDVLNQKQILQRRVLSLSSHLVEWTAFYLSRVNGDNTYIHQCRSWIFCKSYIFNTRSFSFDFFYGKTKKSKVVHQKKSERFWRRTQWGMHVKMMWTEMDIENILCRKLSQCVRQGENLWQALWPESSNSWFLGSINRFRLNELVRHQCNGQVYHSEQNMLLIWLCYLTSDIKSCSMNRALQKNLSKML